MAADREKPQGTEHKELENYSGLWNHTLKKNK